MSVSPRIFISYRQEDSPAYAGRLLDQLSARFGPAQVVGRHSLQHGADFPRAIEESVGSADVLISRRQGEEKDGVFVVKDGVAQFRAVSTGIVGETEIEIREGVQEGEEIVTGSYKTLRTLKHAAKIKIEENGRAS